ncbi:hypothetical protein AVEN_136337-1 [Araneus ventricosus]|uniref:Uncharacterized protein n=1 Tax=Araneus ventricosus TaxID=182803 RepID=A0A4Y2E1G7_ARAVE|nr:hypothetical protein AVEN_136337-1 [Araneus ventricosus]
MQRIANSGSGGVVQCFGPLDRHTPLALVTSYGGTSSHWCTKLPLTVLRTLLHASRQLAGEVRDAYRHTVLEQSTIVTLEGSDWTSESDVTLLHIASTVRHAYLV